MAVAECIELPTKIVMRTIDKDTAVPYGTLMKLEDENTVVVSAANSDPFGGICWVEHTASEGVTELTVAMNGRWSITATGAIPAGNAVSIGGADTCRLATEADTIVGTIMGKNLNTIGGGGGTAIVEVGQLV